MNADYRQRDASTWTHEEHADWQEEYRRRHPTRRPIGCRPNTPAEDAARDTQDYATFEYREQAVEAGRALAGWVTWPQYGGWLDLWIVTARRKSWSTGRGVALRTDGTVR